MLFLARITEKQKRTTDVIVFIPAILRKPPLGFLTIWAVS
jgi:hypothetical protein